MRTMILILLAASIAVGTAPTATANQADPDCEEDQPSIGYNSSAAGLFRDVLDATGHPAGLFVCEGEHWDGQDTVQEDQNPTCSPGVNTDPNDAFFGMCMGPDPNDPPSQDPLNPLALRVGSTNGDEAYAGLNIGYVGRAALYVGPDMTAIYLRDNTVGNALANVVSTLRITQGYVDENDCSQEVYQDGAYNPPSDCGRDNTAITVYYTLP